MDLVVLALNPSPYLEIRGGAFNRKDVAAAEASSWSQLEALYR